MERKQREATHTQKKIRDVFRDPHMSRGDRKKAAHTQKKNEMTLVGGSEFRMRE